MNVNLGAAVFAASMFAVATAQAATVKAVFDGEIVETAGFPGSLLGETLEVILVGDDEAAGTPGAALPFGLTGDATEAYALTSMSLNVAAQGIAETATDATFFVGDNIAFEGSIFDMLIAIGNLGSIQLEFLVAFDPSTYSGTSIGTAVTLGLAQAPVEAEFGRIVSFGDSILANTGIRDLIVEDAGSNPTDDPTTGGGTDLNVVPLPAAGWMLLAAIGGLGAMRRRRT